MLGNTRTISIRIMLLLLLSLVAVFAFFAPRSAIAATNSELNFQGRLLSDQGALVADGNYHVEFKLYSVDAGGSELWTETYTGGNELRIANGYFSANLGELTAFPAAIDWSEELWLGVNIGGLGAAPVWDGEMTPRTRLTSVPYAFAAGGLLSSNGIQTGDDFVQISPTDIQDLTTGLQAIRLNQTGAGGLLQLQGDGSDVFTVDKTGQTVVAGSVDINGPSLDIGSATQSGGLVLNDGSGNTLTLQTGTQAGDLTFTLPSADGTAGQCLTTNGSGVFSFAACGSGGGGDVLKDGNTDGADLTIGTNDAFAFNFETDGVTRVEIDETGDVAIDGITLQVDATNDSVNIAGATSLEDLNVAGAINFGNTTNANAGTIRWTGTDFEGYDGTEWKSLTLSSGGDSVAAQVYSSSTGNFNTAAYQPVPFDQASFVDSGITHSTTVQNTRVVLDDPGRYFISYSVAFDTANNARRSLECAVRLNGTTILTPSQSYDYARNNTDDNGSLSATTAYESAAANEYYEIVCRQAGTGGTVALLANQSWTLVTNGSGGGSAATPPIGDVFEQDGNAFGATAILGTNDTQALGFETDGALRMTIDSSGEITALGDVNLNGSVALGDAATDIITFAGQVGSDILPSADDTFDLGSPTLRWQDVYVGPDSLHVVCNAGECGAAADWAIGVEAAAGVSQGNFTIELNGTDYFSIAPSGNVGVGDTTPTALFTVGTNDALQVDAGGNLRTIGNVLADGGTVGVGSNTQAGIIRISDGTANSTNLQSAALGADLTFTLPSTDGSAGECLTTDGTGVLSFADCGGGGAGDIINGGNTEAADVTIGTNDIFALNLETDNVVRATIGADGDIEVAGTNTNVDSRLYIEDAVTSQTQIVVGSGVTNTYAFDADNDGDEAAWTFVSDNGGNGLNPTNTGRAWSHAVGDTPSGGGGIGPNGGEGGNPDGYIYTEASAPTAFNDTFHVTYNTVLDAASSDWVVDFYWNQKGDSNLATLDLQTNEAGAGWTTQASYGGGDQPTNGANTWNFETLDMSALVANANTQIRFLVTMPAGGTIWNNDFGLDTITVREASAAPSLVYGDNLIEGYNANTTSDVDLLVLRSDVGEVGDVKFRVDSDGDIYSDGTNNISGGADIAENYQNYDDAQPGDVVYFVDNRTVAKTSQESQAALAGVVSSDVAIVLDADVDGVPVGLKGRVPTRVSVSNGAISRGDYLTSGLEGRAVKAIRSGSVIGVAMEDASADGTIDVFVGLTYYEAPLVLSLDGIVDPVSQEVVLPVSVELSAQLEGLYEEELAESAATASSEGEQGESEVIIEGFRSLQGQINELEINVLDLGILAQQWQSGQLQGALVFEDETRFFGSVIFESFVTFTRDTAGEVVVEAGTLQTEVVFDSEYPRSPHIQLTPQDFIEGQYRIKTVDQTGFTVELSKVQLEDINFNWQATLVAEDLSDQTTFIDPLEQTQLTGY